MANIQSSENVVFEFTAEEKQQIREHLTKYPDSKSAVMPVLWIAQEKFGWLSKEAMKLVAEELSLSFAHVYGVASFYTMYFKKQVPKYLFDICTCFTCGVCGGNEIYESAKEYLQVDENGFSADGKFWVRQAECLGACDTAPVMQVANRRVVHNLTNESIKKTVEDLRKGKMPEFKAIAPIYDLSNSPTPAIPGDDASENLFAEAGEEE